MTTPTPEQLQSWRTAFEAQLLPATEMTRCIFGKYCLNGLERQWQGYLHAKQETEQSFEEIIAYFKLNSKIIYTGTEAAMAIKELLND